MNDKDHLVGQLTNNIESIAKGIRFKELHRNTALYYNISFMLESLQKFKCIQALLKDNICTKILLPPQGESYPGIAHTNNKTSFKVSAVDVCGAL